jgi:hypothetical protein
MERNQSHIGKPSNILSVKKPYEYLRYHINGARNLAVFENKKCGYLSVSNGLLSTTDGGLHWRRRILTAGEEVGTINLSAGTLPPPVDLVIFPRQHRFEHPFF